MKWTLYITNPHIKWAWYTERRCIQFQHPKAHIRQTITSRRSSTYTVTQPNCPATLTQPALPSPARPLCTERRSFRLRWLGSEPNSYARNNFVKDGLGIGGFVKLRGCPNTVFCAPRKTVVGVFCFRKAVPGRAAGEAGPFPYGSRSVEGAACRL